MYHAQEMVSACTQEECVFEVSLHLIQAWCAKNARLLSQSLANVTETASESRTFGTADTSSCKKELMLAEDSLEHNVQSGFAEFLFGMPVQVRERPVLTAMSAAAAPLRLPASTSR